MANISTGGKASKSKDLLLTLDTSCETPLFEQLYNQIRSAIESGKLVEGNRLPSVRALCQDLCISHTTVERTYLQLSTEGYVRNVPRSGYIVEHIDTGYLRQRDSALKEAQAGLKHLQSDRPPYDELKAQTLTGRHAKWDFSYTDMRPGSFPTQIWHKLTDDVLFGVDAIGLGRYPIEDGPSELAQQLASYLQRTRGVNCATTQVIVKPGTEAALTALLALFDPKTDVVGCEEPGYGSIRSVAQRAGFKVVPLPVDQGAQAFLDVLHHENPTVTFTTPSHQFPTGTILSLESRIELLKWADTNGAFVIEDDSCNEYRYDVRPIPSLQSLDFHGRVIYLGNFSKVLSPSLRMAYMVLPFRLLRRYWRSFGHSLGDVSWLNQQVLAAFIRNGYWEQHIRRMVTANHHCHDVLLSELKDKFGDMITIGGINSGIHFYVSVHNGMNQSELLQSAFAQGANVYGTERYWFSKPAPPDTLMIGFSSIAAKDIPDGVAALRRAWL